MTDFPQGAATLSPLDRRVFYKGIDAVEIEDANRDKGALRLFRRRGLFGMLRRQDVFHPPGEWWSVELHKDGRCYVRLADRPVTTALPQEDKG